MGTGRKGGQCSPGSCEDFPCAKVSLHFAPEGCLCSEAQQEKGEEGAIVGAKELGMGGL